ncbi:glycosyl hydrolase family 38 protein [Necator americanus]|uniref:Glycosyl hydrolase family 38 protein n=1 Tax=Necator americanus TaxID=51031 RepID=W2T884_NECAM|nr:glycosyl hydrolase family 38 protein [Necator americanus]ETN78225.1 glycosyl hydrolase family 38 protein [Necator americanus]
MLVRSALVRRRRWSWLVLVAILVSTAFIFYTIDMQSRTAVQRSKRVPLTEFEYSDDVRGEMDLSSDLSYGVCSSSPQNNTTSEIDTFEVYRDHIAHGVSPPASEIQRLPSRDKLKVFVLPFTHVDPGMISEKPKKSFSDVFFDRLVKSGRLELASGSWVMTDEANVYYPVTVDNIVEGHQFLYEEFDDVKHTVVWSNDPFGYSNSVPYIFTQAGIKRAVINRVHHDVKRYLQKRKAIPFEWRQYFGETLSLFFRGLRFGKVFTESISNPDGSSGMLTHVLPYTHYDILNSCGPNPGICCEFDFKRITHFSCPGTKPVPITSANVATK